MFKKLMVSALALCSIGASALTIEEAKEDFNSIKTKSGNVSVMLCFTGHKNIANMLEPDYVDCSNYTFDKEDDFHAKDMVNTISPKKFTKVNLKQLKEISESEEVITEMLNSGFTLDYYSSDKNLIFKYNVVLEIRQLVSEDGNTTTYLPTTAESLLDITLNKNERIKEFNFQNNYLLIKE
jgi:hypothetical protein